MVGWLCFTSHRQQGHLETAPHSLSLLKDVKLSVYTAPTKIEPQAVAWQFISQPLCHASFKDVMCATPKYTIYIVVTET